jgi:two-component system chemotaxis response regulator CheY
MNTAIKILVVDDDKVFRNAVPAWLSRHGFTDILSLSSSIEALERIAVDGDYDLLITDFNMPEMTGVQLIERVRSLGRIEPPKFIVMSAGKNSEVALRGGADRFFSKLTPLDELSMAIAELFP